MKFVSWNVNGIRSAMEKGAMDYLRASRADCICLQEIKADEAVVKGFPWPRGRKAYVNAAGKRGYAGAAVVAKPEPLSVSYGLGDEDFDGEGRVIRLEYEAFHLVNVYTPNAQRDLVRLPYRQRWDEAFLAYLKSLERSKPVVFCGDLNVAHTEIDLANPRSNVKNAGFTPEERAGFGRLLEAGFVDTFREFVKGPGHYTWWTYRANARARNIGWRIDYFGISASLRPALRRSAIRSDVCGSDHCPIELALDL